ncbi:MAG: hypothetical protein GY756_10025 [bacterium]|nr:hypothetical protein [bacterium]
MHGIGNAITKVGKIRTIRNVDISGYSEKSWLQVDSIPTVEDKHLKRDSKGFPVEMTAEEIKAKDTLLQNSHKEEVKAILKNNCIDLLRSTDYTQLLDTGINDTLSKGLNDKAKKYATYRKNIRDVMESFKDPNVDLNSIKMPKKPE